MSGFFIFIIKNIQTDSIYVGMSKSQLPYFDPTKFLIEQNDKNGNYCKFAESYQKYKKINHVFTKVDKAGFYNLSKDDATAKRDKLIKFFQDQKRSLNDLPTTHNLEATLSELESI